MEDRKGSRVKALIASFEERITRFINPQLKPITVEHHDRATQTITTKSIPSSPQELPTTEEHSNSCLPSIEVLKSKYFHKDPINKWVICNELQRAINNQAPYAYQKSLLNLLELQTQKMDELCIGIQQQYQPLEVSPESSLAQDEIPDSDLLSLLSGTLQESFSNFFGLSQEFNRFTPYVREQPNIERQAGKETEELSIRPTQEELQAYPIELIKIIRDFLNLTNDFSKKRIAEDYKKFETLDDATARAKYFKDVVSRKGESSGRILEKQLGHIDRSKLTTRELINQSFKHQLEAQWANFQKTLRIHLNTEFREMMRVVLYSLLINLRKELSHNRLWRKYNPKELLRPYSQEWLNAHQDDLKKYLRRVDSEHETKTILIEYPIFTTYRVKSSVVNHQEEKTYEEEKTDDILHWLERITRWKIDPSGTIDWQKDHLSVFDSDAAFIDWLSKDPSIPFIYTRKEDADLTQIDYTHKMVCLVNIAKIQNIFSKYPSYFEELKQKVAYYSPPLEISEHLYHTNKP